MIHPTPWTARRFGYERTALLDANGAEVAEFVDEVEAALCAALVNDNSFRATLDTSRPPFARLKAPQRPQTAAHAVKEMLSRKRLPGMAPSEKAFLSTARLMHELAGGNAPMGPRKRCDRCQLFVEDDTRDGTNLCWCPEPDHGKVP